MTVDKGDDSCSEENKCLEKLRRSIPRGAAESSSLSGVRATAESTPGTIDTIIFPPENGGECVY